MGWMEETRQGIRGAQEPFNALGRAKYMNNFAEGGIASYMFPHKDIKIQRGFLGMKAAPGSRAYNANVDAVIKHFSQAPGLEGPIHPNEAAARKLKAKYGGGLGIKSRIGRVARGGIMGAAFLALPALTTDGDAGDKAQAVVGGAAGWLGSEIGMKGGAMAGGAIGSFVPVIGTAVGAFAGAVIGTFAGGSVGYDIGETVFNTLDSVAERGRKRRTSNWVGDTSAFQTQKASTMRQASLQMMNNGLMTARSALGNEGIMLHK